jgi:hypothetical protein
MLFGFYVAFQNSWFGLDFNPTSTCNDVQILLKKCWNTIHIVFGFHVKFQHCWNDLQSSRSVCKLGRQLSNSAGSSRPVDSGLLGRSTRVFSAGIYFYNWPSILIGYSISRGLYLNLKGRKITQPAHQRWFNVESTSALVRSDVVLRLCSGWLCKPDLESYSDVEIRSVSNVKIRLKSDLDSTVCSGWFCNWDCLSKH